MSTTKHFASPLVSYRHRAALAVITINNPPVNALSAAVRQGLMEALQRAANDQRVQAAVLAAQGRAFIAGADIREFGKPPLPPSLPEVVALMDDFPKPLVAAMNGATLGGGLEIALTCHYRVATHTAQFGFPEVKLGLLPGAGGTQRLPRLVGMRQALDIILSGTPLAAVQAKKMGVVDEVIHRVSALPSALTAAARLAKTKRPLRRVSNLSIAADAAAPLLAEYAERLRASKLFAPPCCVQAVAAAVLPFAAGVKHERRLFMRCMRSPQRKALVHAFMAERQAGKIEQTSAPPSHDIRAAAVVGGGGMGAGIAVCLADAGIRTTLLETNADALNAGLARIQSLYARRRQNGRLSAAAARRYLSLIRGGDYADIGTADLIIEAVPEEMALKRQVFAALDKHAKAGALLATNTSSLNVNELARATSRRSDVLGLHFFMPAHHMRLLEIVRGRDTSSATLAAALRLAKTLGKAPVVVGVCPGFVGNRLYTGYGREAEFLLEEGATPQQVDAALRGFGMAMGPLAARDLSGLDNGRNIRQHVWANLSSDYPRPGVLERLYQADRLGQKSGAGYYRYEKGKRHPIPDRATLAFIKDAAAARGICRRRLSSRFIVDRCLLALINEGAKVLDEGIARRASDIDMIYVTGYGFPSYLGGPMFCADKMGAAYILARVQEFHRQFGRWWEPAPLLVRLAKNGGTFIGAS